MAFSAGAILFVLHTGIAWEHLPQEMGYGSGMTCWRRLAEWNASGVWQRLHEVLLDRLRAADALDFSRAATTSSSSSRSCRPSPRCAASVSVPAGAPDVVLADRGYNHDGAWCESFRSGR